MASAIVRLPKNTIELTLTVPAAEVQKMYEHVVEDAVANAEIKGFRKGKAPRAKVEEQLDKVKVNEEILRHLLPKVYSDAVREHNISPIINPKVEILSM